MPANDYRSAALVDRVARTDLVDLGGAVLVGEGVVHPQHGDAGVDLVEGDLVVGAGDGDGLAGTRDGQRVVRAADVQRLAVGAVEGGGGAHRPVVHRVPDLEGRGGASAARSRRRGGAGTGRRAAAFRGGRRRARRRAGRRTATG